MGDDVRRAKVVGATDVNDDAPVARPRRKARTPRWVVPAVIVALVVATGVVALGGGVAYQAVKSTRALLAAQPSAQAVPTTAAPGAVAEPATPPLPWGGVAKVKEIRVEVGTVHIKQITGTTPENKPCVSATNTLRIQMFVLTEDKTRAFKVGAAVESATAVDNFGNVLPVRTLTTNQGVKCKVDTQLEPGKEYNVQSNGPQLDTLYFEVPVEAATGVTLTMSAEPYGGRGSIAFTIPAGAWRGELLPVYKRR